MLGMGNMRQWLMNISLVGGWFPAAAFAVIAVLSVTLLVSAAVSKRDGRILATVLPIGVAAVSGMVGYVVAWLLSDVFVVFGVGLGSRVMSWVAAGFAIAGFAIVHIVLSRGMMRVAAAILTVFAITGRGDRHRPIVRRIRHHRLAVRRGFLQPSRSDRTGQTQGPHHRRTVAQTGRQRHNPQYSGERNRQQNRHSGHEIAV